VVEAGEQISEESAEAGVDIAQLAFAVLFLVLAVLTWRKRPRRGEEDKPSKPSLISRLDGLSAVAALGVGVVQGLVVIKNIPLALSAGAVIGEAMLTGADAVIAVVVFALVATLGVIVPLAVALVGGARLNPALRSARDWFEANMSGITLAVLLVLGALFLGQGLGLLD